MPLTLNPNPSDAAMEVQPYDIAADQRATVAKLAGSDEIDALTAQIDVYDMPSIVTFGAAAAEKISKASDDILRSMSVAQVSDPGGMMQALANIMAQFRLDEVKENSSFLGRLFANPKKQLDRVLDKYHTMGDEVDKIYVQLRAYEAELTRSNRQLEDLFQANVGYFHELEKYIVAGDQGCKEIEDYMAQRKAEMERTGDQSISFELQTLEQAKTMLQQRTLDLRTAEAVALQSIPMIKAMQYNNLNLVRKINSAFIITLPVFKQALAQAIMLKRQKLQSDALSMLERRTNEMLLKNARNTVEQTKATARLAGTPSIQAETLEKSWKTIVGGIEETRKLQQSAQDQRHQDQVKLENIRRDFMAKYNAR